MEKYFVKSVGTLFIFAKMWHPKVGVRNNDHIALCPPRYAFITWR